MMPRQNCNCTHRYPFKYFFAYVSRIFRNFITFIWESSQLDMEGEVRILSTVTLGREGPGLITSHKHVIVRVFNLFTMDRIRQFLTSLNPNIHRPLPEYFSSDCHGILRRSKRLRWPWGFPTCSRCQESPYWTIYLLLHGGRVDFNASHQRTLNNAFCSEMLYYII